MLISFPFTMLGAVSEIQGPGASIKSSASGFGNEHSEQMQSISGLLR